MIAGGGLNVRDRASALRQSHRPAAARRQGDRRGRSPTEADNFTWWQVDNGAGMVGWVAAGPKEIPGWHADQPAGSAEGGGKLVNRADQTGRSRPGHDAGGISS